MFSFRKFFGFQKAKRNVDYSALTIQEDSMKAFTRPVGQRTGLFFSDGTLVTTYARERDAVRGASRRGLALISN